MGHSQCNHRVSFLAAIQISKTLIWSNLGPGCPLTTALSCGKTVTASICILAVGVPCEIGGNRDSVVFAVAFFALESRGTHEKRTLAKQLERKQFLVVHTQPGSCSPPGTALSSTSVFYSLFFR